MSNEETEIVIPIFMPIESGVSDVVLANATLSDGKLNVEFRENAPGIAIQRMLERGVLLGMSFVLADPAEEDEEETAPDE